MTVSNRVFSLACALMFSTAACASVNNQTPPEYTEWLNGLKKEMVGRGISQKTIDSVYQTDFYTPNPKVIKIDRKQAEFALTSTDYLNRVITADRVAKARRHYRELKPVLDKIEQKYGVPAEYLIAFWGVETNFGQNFGGFDVIEVLTILSYDKRRPKFFKEELYQALKIIDEWNIDHTKMQGSWAGAMGHFQFMPSTFNAYAVDYNQDGQIDIWHSFDDAAASAANYLSQLGWQKNLPWGTEVSLPWNFDFSSAGRETVKTVKEWKKAGVRTFENKNLPFDETLKASVIVPEGKKGRAYLVLENFRKIMIWNRSENYALAIGMLADYTAGSKPWKKQTENHAVRLKTDDVYKVQSFINKLGFSKVDEDGMLGSKTREAVKQVQKAARMPQDGYPDAVLLSKINNYNPDIGFAVPAQPRKLHK